LMKDVINMQKRPQTPGMEYKYSPLVVLNGFSSSGANENNGDDSVKKIMAAMFQNIFPTIDIELINLKDCRRVVLFNLTSTTVQEDEEKSTVYAVEVRHYLITASPVGLTRSLKKIVKEKLPSLGKLNDVSDYVLNSGNGAAESSDSEAEDLPESRVVLPQDFVGRGNLKSQKSAVRLKELGPRIRLQLLKVEDSLNEGQVLYHRYIHKSSEEAERIHKQKLQEQKLKAKRTEQQNENVRKKTELKNEKKRKRDTSASDEECAIDEEEASNGDSGEESNSISEEVDAVDNVDFSGDFV